MKEYRTYACYLRDEDQLKRSSSGGFFYGIAEEFIKSGGIVFGATMKDDMNISHIYVDTIEKLEQLRKTKYVQSRIGDAYIEVTRFLRKGKKVLFSGTPCQVAGLRKYLGRIDDTNLYCVEVICHGVSNQKEFNAYIARTNGTRSVKEFEFRNKQYGWEKYVVTYLRNGEEVRSPGENDEYMRGFLNKYCLRKSCYNCKFRAENSVADLTMGDYWGIKECHPDFYNPNGVSVVIIRNTKGMKLFEESKSRFEYILSSYYKAACFNSQLLQHRESIRLRKLYYELEQKRVGKSEEFALLNEQDVFCNIMVIGSYNSRLIVNLLHQRNTVMKLSQHITNTTIVSMLAPKVMQIREEEIVCSNRYRQQSVLFDMKKMLEEKLKEEKKGGWLVIDLLEERYFNYIFSNGSVLTDSEAFLDTGMRLTVKKMGFLEIPMEKWKNQCLKFINIIKKYFPPEKVILNCLYLSERYGDEMRQLEFNDINYIRSVNEKLEQCYRFIIQNFEGIESIQSIEHQNDYCADSFVYGCKPIYYNYAKYCKLVSAIECIIMKNID